MGNSSLGKAGLKNCPAVRIVLKLSAVALFTILVFTFVFGLYRVVDNCMFPMMKEGDLCLFYRLEKPYLGDAVLYKKDGRIHIGRVCAAVGQEVGFSKEGAFEVDGAVPGEMLPYATYQAKDSNVSYPIRLGDGEYFVLNDYRDETSDSREYGVVRDEDIIGKAKFIFRRRGV